MVPLAAIWNHELPLYKHTLFWNRVDASSLAPVACELLWLSVSFAPHGRVHMHFQISPRIHVFWINKVDASHSLSIVEFGHLICPQLFFSFLSGFPNFGPYFRPHVLRSGSCLNCFQSLPGPHASSWRFLFQ